uniref:G_PROTEIN_RECEP_F1_2 domain-containing protein n=1 Tax=Panagrellus redivivus TaxID=6233 RepID=A0A7E4ZUF0_PANRE
MFAHRDFSGARVCATGLIVIVCFDRLWAIKAPLKSHTSPRPVFAAIVLVAGSSALLNAFHNIAYVAPKNDRPNATTDSNLTVSTSTPLLKEDHFAIIVKVFATASVFLNTFAMVLLILSNALLLHYLRSRHQNFQVPRWNSSKMSFDSGCNTSKESYGRTAITDPDARSSKVWSRRQCSNERKITFAVFLIVCCYTVTNLPSTALFFYIYTIRAGKFYVNNGQVAAFYLSNALIVFGKIANFFFLCHSSAYYRRQLQKQLCSWARVFWFAKTTPVPSTTGVNGMIPGVKDGTAMRVHYAKVERGPG